jgi:FkbM family methyltransferase
METWRVAESENTNIVAAAYEALLLRKPDPKGIVAWVDLLDQGKAGYVELLKGMLGSPEFGANAQNFLQTYNLISHCRFINDHSQYGEIEILIRDMVNQSALQRYVVDIGARGRDRSNSYDLVARFGWRGLLIEANPALVNTITEEFKTCDVSLECCAVSDTEGEQEFFVGINDDVSSLRKDQSEAWGQIQRTIRVKTRRIGSILQQHAVPLVFDLLSIDIEGEDIRVLNDLMDNTQYRPRYVIIEASYNFQTNSLSGLPFSTSVRDAFDLIGRTSANLILRGRIV